LENRRRESVREEWERLPLAWDAARIARTPRTVARNWAVMTETMREQVRSFARTHGRVILLDVGCGNGGFADGLEEAIAYYIGVDPAREMLLQGRSRQRNVYVQGVGEMLPIAEGIADVVVLKTVLTHCYSPEEVMRESARVLKPGGISIISTANVRAWYHPFRRWRRRFAGRRGMPDGHLHAFDEASLTRLVTDCGLCLLCRRILGYGVLPRGIDRHLPRRVVERLGDLADFVGSRLFPTRGGALIVVARKPE